MKVCKISIEEIMETTKKDECNSLKKVCHASTKEHNIDQKV